MLCYIWYLHLGFITTAAILLGPSMCAWWIVLETWFPITKFTPTFAKDFTDDSTQHPRKSLEYDGPLLLRKHQVYSSWFCRFKSRTPKLQVRSKTNEDFIKKWILHLNIINIFFTFYKSDSFFRNSIYKKLCDTTSLHLFGKTSSICITQLLRDLQNSSIYFYFKTNFIHNGKIYRSTDKIWVNTEHSDTINKNIFQMRRFWNTNGF